jgi:hypothetical protein
MMLKPPKKTAGCKILIAFWPLYPIGEDLPKRELHTRI